jgi:hypothetical protein
MDNGNSKLTSYKKRKLLSERLVAANNNNNSAATTMHQQEQEQQWFHHEEDSLMIYALSFVDVKSLLQKETVSKTWRKPSKKAMRNKCCGRPKTIQSKEELKDAITKYCRYKATPMEEIAGTYGYPMDC